MKISEMLNLNKQVHPELGEIYVLNSMIDDEDSKAFTVKTKTLSSTKNGKAIKTTTGVDLRLSKETATKLALSILKMVGEL